VGTPFPRVPTPLRPCSQRWLYSELSIEYAIARENQLQGIKLHAFKVHIGVLPLAKLHKLSFNTQGHFEKLCFIVV